MPTTNPDLYESQSYNSSSGTIVSGWVRTMIGDTVATRALKIRESSAICQMDSAAGVVYNLPAITADNIGTAFEFINTVTITSNSAKIICSPGDFLLGTVAVAVIGAADVDYFAFNGTTHVSCQSNGSTTGGVIGGRVRVTAINATQWYIEGILVGSGVQVTPASTT
jgi:hypothetical protein